jgi:hypothetical protein
MTQNTPQEAQINTPKKNKLLKQLEDKDDYVALDASEQLIAADESLVYQKLFDRLVKMIDNSSNDLICRNALNLMKKLLENSKYLEADHIQIVVPILASKLNSSNVQLLNTVQDTLLKLCYPVNQELAQLAPVCIRSLFDCVGEAGSKIDTEQLLLFLIQNKLA